MKYRSRNIALGASFGLAVLLGASPSQAQWWNVFERDRPAAQPAQPQSTSPAATSQPLGFDQAQPGQVDRLEADVRRLTGEVEVLQHEMQQLRAALQQLHGGAPVAAQPQSTELPADPSIDAEARAALEDQLATAGDAPIGDAVGVPMDISLGEGPMISPGEPPRLLGTITAAEAEAIARGTAVQPTDPGAPMNLSALAQPVPSDAEAETASLPAETPDLAYDRAYGLIVAGDYGPAEEEFRQFIQIYPDSPLVPDARYWLGETYFARSDFQNAADAFLSGYRADPNSRKAPDTLLKLALSLDALGQRKAACSTYAELLNMHDEVSNALLQRVKAEQVRAEC